MQPKTMHDQQYTTMTRPPPLLRSRPAARVLLVISIIATLNAWAATAIGGAGATFPEPLYRAWALEYQRITGGEVRYEAVGSGAGLARVEHHEVDFGGTDAPLTPAQLDAAQLLQFPTVIGGVVPVINIRGIRPGELRLTGPLLADIYLGRVRHWNDPAIAALNPTLHLPHANITVVHRQEASGSSLLWTTYLASGNAAWREQVGAGLLPAWPNGTGAKGNEGVATLVQRTRFAIGYVEYSFARLHALSDVALRNRSGNFVRARADNFAAAAAFGGWHESGSMLQLPPDAPGQFSWPITGASFILMPRIAPDAEREQAVLRFFDWALHHGGDMVERLDYAPVPQPLLDALPQLWRSFHDSAGRPLWP